MRVKVSKLTHHPLNKEIYSLSDIDDLVASIEEVGLLQPLVINQHYQVISGNRRLVAIKKLNLNSVNVEKVKVSKKDVAFLLIHHNKQRVKSCREILNEYHLLEKQYKKGQGRRTDLPTSVCTNRGLTTRDIVSGKLGVSSSRLAKLLFVEKENDTFIDLIDKGSLTTHQSYLLVVKAKKEEISKEPSRGRRKNTGDNFCFYRKSSDKMTEVNDGAIQMVFTSPPYYNKRSYSSKKGWLGNEKTPEQYVDRLVSHLDDTYRVLSPKGSFFLNIGDTYQDGNLLNIPHKVVIGLQDEGWILRNTIIWKKRNPKPSSSKNNLCPSYEFIFHLVKSKKYYYKLTLTKSKDTDLLSRPIINRTVGQSSQMHASPFVPRNGKNMGDYWEEDVVNTATANNVNLSNKLHPAPFPEKIVILPLLQTTKENDLVLDPFHGTGTTGRVSIQYGRRYIGYDIKSYR
jgi:site-specific DNA-methyltransferase (adenine-specific)